MKAVRIIWGIFLGLSLSLWAGCAYKIPDPGQRLSLARKLAAQDTGIRENVFDTENFRIFAFESIISEPKGRNLSIYIEGDGMAWITSSFPSDNPTPLNPVGLRLFLKDPSSCKIYLARPCQYMDSPFCQQKYWTSHRFSKAVIEAYHRVLDRIKEEYSPEGFSLFGYSGGGTVAALLAAQRDDVHSLVTVAGNLDIDHWTRLHRLTLLSGSLNPANFTKELEPVRQYHFIGGKDRIIPPSVFYSFQNQFANKENIDYKILDEFSHSCCWDVAWEPLLNHIEAEP